MGKTLIPAEMLLGEYLLRRYGAAVADYAEGGMTEYWIVDPLTSTFLVDRPAGKRLAELKHGQYDSEAVPGFWRDVEWLWQQPLPDGGECLARILDR